MNTDNYKDFLSVCTKQINENKNVIPDNSDLGILTGDIFSNFEYIRQIASNIRYKFINGIDENLIAFDKNFSSGGGNIHWCIDYNDFLSRFDKVLQKNKVSKVNIFSSKLSKELGIERFISDNNYNSDSESEDCIVFTPQFGIVSTGSLFMNFDSAYDMELVLNGKLKIFIISICDFLFKTEETEIFSHIYSVYKNSVDFPYLTSLYTPSPVGKNSNVHLFLIDNGRSNVLENKDIRKILTCICCDACNKVCPVYNIIGDKPYDNVFTGPVANVILPFIENAESYKHLSFSCTSCGNCSGICPIKIPVSELIIANRNYFFENKLMEMRDERFTHSVFKNILSRKKLNAKKWVKNIRIKALSNSKIIDEYKFEQSTFNQQYINIKYGKK